MRKVWVREVKELSQGDEQSQVGTGADSEASAGGPQVLLLPGGASGLESAP